MAAAIENLGRICPPEGNRVKMHPNPSREKNFATKNAKPAKMCQTVNQIEVFLLFCAGVLSRRRRFSGADPGVASGAKIRLQGGQNVIWPPPFKIELNTIGNLHRPIKYQHSQFGPFCPPPPPPPLEIFWIRPWRFLPRAGAEAVKTFGSEPEQEPEPSKKMDGSRSLRLRKLWSYFGKENTRYFSARSGSRQSRYILPGAGHGAGDVQNFHGSASLNLCIYLWIFVRNYYISSILSS